jgi:hypothetical protein
MKFSDNLVETVIDVILKTVLLTMSHNMFRILTIRGVFVNIGTVGIIFI